MELIIKFTDASESFTLGVEFGRLLEKMERGEMSVFNNKFPVHVNNKEVIDSCCRVYGYIPSWGDIHYGEWIDFIGIKNTISNN